MGSTEEEVYLEFTRQTALGRFIEEEDVANAIDFLVSARLETSPATTSPSTPAGMCETVPTSGERSTRRHVIDR